MNNIALKDMDSVSPWSHLLLVLQFKTDHYSFIFTKVSALEDNTKWILTGCEVAAYLMGFGGQSNEELP